MKTDFICYLYVIILFASLSALSCSETTTTEKKDVAKALKSEEPQEASGKIILFFGNSLTAAYGLDREEGFTSLIQEKIDASGKNYRSVNAGLSGETTAGGLSRVDWILDRQPVEIFVLELGGNDGLRGLDPENSYENLKGIVTKVRGKYPDCKIILAGMQAPPNMGGSYTTAFKNVFPRLARELDLALIPFLLEGVAGDKSLNQKDGIHPTAEGQVILSENIWEILRPML